METPYKEIKENDSIINYNKKDKHVRFQSSNSNTKNTSMKKGIFGSLTQKTIDKNNNNTINNIEFHLKSKLHSNQQNSYEKTIKPYSIKTPLTIDNQQLRQDLFSNEIHSFSSRSRNRHNVFYESVTNPLLLSQKIMNDKPIPKLTEINKYKHMYSKTLVFPDRYNMKNNNYHKGKSVLFKILRNSMNMNNSSSIINEKDLTERSKHHHYQTYSLTERNLKIPKLNSNDNSMFLNVIANLPSSSTKLNTRNHLILQNELRKLKTCDDNLNNNSSLSSSKKYNLKLSNHAITEVFKKRVLKEVKTIQEDTKKNPLPKQTETKIFDDIDLTIEQPEPIIEELKQFNKSKTKIVPAKNRKSFLFAKRKSLSIRPDILESYGKTKLTHDNLNKQKMKTRLKVMDQQLQILFKEDYENMKHRKNQPVNAKNLDRVVRFLNTIRFNHKQFIPLSSDEMEQPEKISEDNLLHRDYITAKTLNKLGPAKYVKTQFKPKTIRKYFETKGYLMGEK